MLHQGRKRRRGQGVGRQETGLAGVAHEGEGGVQSDQREPGSPTVQEVNGGDGTDIQALQGPGGQAAWCLESDCPKVGQPSTSKLCSDWLAHQEHPPHFPRSPGGTRASSYLCSPPLPSPRASTALCRAHQAAGVSALSPSPNPDCAHRMLTGLCCPLSPATPTLTCPPASPHEPLQPPGPLCPGPWRLLFLYLEPRPPPPSPGNTS